MEGRYCVVPMLAAHSVLSTEADYPDISYIELHVHPWLSLVHYEALRHGTRLH